MNETKKYLSDRINSELRTANILETRIKTDREEAILLQKGLQANKKDNPEALWSDSKEALIKVNEKHYYAFLIEQQLKAMLSSIMELSTMADILNIELELEGDHPEVIKNLKNINNNLFAVDQKGEIIIPDKEAKRMWEEGMNASQTDDKLQEMYEMIPV